MLILLVFVGLCNDVLTYPNKHASYAVSVRQYRILPFGFLQCKGHPNPPCHLLTLPGVTRACEGLSPSGKFIPIPLLSKKFICIFEIFLKLTNGCAHAHAGHTHWVIKHADLSGFLTIFAIFSSVTGETETGRKSRTASYPRTIMPHYAESLS